MLNQYFLGPEIPVRLCDIGQFFRYAGNFTHIFAHIEIGKQLDRPPFARAHDFGKASCRVPSNLASTTEFSSPLSKASSAFGCTQLLLPSMNSAPQKANLKLGIIARRRERKELALHPAKTRPTFVFLYWVIWKYPFPANLIQGQQTAKINTSTSGAINCNFRAVERAEYI